jgi:hypothetical protein
MKCHPQYFTTRRSTIMKKLFGFLVVLFLTCGAMVPTARATEAPNLMVGRVYQVEGSLLRYVTEDDDWVAVVQDAPFSTGDTLYTGRNGKAELVVPNGTWIRVDDNTQVQFIGLDSDVSEIDIGAGLGRFYNKDSDLVIKATSPFGYVLVYPGSSFDYYVGENSAEVVPIKGKITFVHTRSNARYEVYPGNPSILADQYQVSSGEAGVDPDWDGWNRSRESFWASRSRTTGPSAQYLPAALRQDAYVFEENGRWERVYYDGGERLFWRPTRVNPDWAPFTNGRWTEWYGDQTWIPSEPFGYVTHHYGNWIYAGGHWYWAPPVARVAVGLPLLNLGFFWYPGRVSWIHSGGYVGWVPLAPRETYYSHYHWGGPHVVRVTNINITQINIHTRNYANARHAVVVPQHNFYTVNNYRSVRVTNINNTTIINNYQAAPVVNNTVIKDYSSIRQRHNFADIQVREKPHKAVTERIVTNQRIIKQGKIEKASVMDQQVKSIKEGKINRDVRIQQPKVTNYVVPADEVNRPKSELKLQQKEIKRRAARDPKEEQEQSLKPSAKPDRPSVKPGRIETEKPGKPAPRFEGNTVPEKRAVPAPKPETVKPVKPVPKAERQAPEKVAPKSEETNGVKPARPAPKPGRVAPDKTDKPSDEPESVKPVRPRPNEKTDGIVPPKPISRQEGTKIWL